jgi:hypothetical protein
MEFISYTGAGVDEEFQRFEIPDRGDPASFVSSPERSLGPFGVEELTDLLVNRERRAGRLYWIRIRGERKKFLKVGAANRVAPAVETVSHDRGKRSSVHVRTSEHFP